MSQIEKQGKKGVRQLRGNMSAGSKCGWIHNCFVDNSRHWSTPGNYVTATIATVITRRAFAGIWTPSPLAGSFSRTALSRTPSCGVNRKVRANCSLTSSGNTKLLCVNSRNREPRYCCRHVSTDTVQHWTRKGRTYGPLMHTVSQPKRYSGIAFM